MFFGSEHYPTQYTVQPISPYWKVFVVVFIQSLKGSHHASTKAAMNPDHANTAPDSPASASILPFSICFSIIFSANGRYMVCASFLSAFCACKGARRRSTGKKRFRFGAKTFPAFCSVCSLDVVRSRTMQPRGNELFPQSPLFMISLEADKHACVLTCRHCKKSWCYVK